jgi:hypothetical protein
MYAYDRSYSYLRKKKKKNFFWKADYLGKLLFAYLGFPPPPPPPLPSPPLERQQAYYNSYIPRTYIYIRVRNSRLTYIAYAQSTVQQPRAGLGTCIFVRENPEIQISPLKITIAPSYSSPYAAVVHTSTPPRKQFVFPRGCTVSMYVH